MYWGLGGVKVPLHHLYSPHLLVKFLLVPACGRTLKAEPLKILMFSLVCVCVYILSILSLFLLLFFEIFLKLIIFSQSILCGSAI